MTVMRLPLRVSLDQYHHSIAYFDVNAVDNILHSFLPTSIYIEMYVSMEDLINVIFWIVLGN